MDSSVIFLSDNRVEFVDVREKIILTEYVKLKKPDRVSRC